MPRYRQALPQLDGSTFLTDGGLETWLIYQEGVELPSFAAFPLIANETGKKLLTRYFEPYLQTARKYSIGFILSTPTWRANRDWGKPLGYSSAELEEINRGSVAFAMRLRDAFGGDQSPIVIDGVIGPRGDGYRPDARMSESEAEKYHRQQIEVFRDTEADMVSALTITYAAESIGVTRAAKACAIPVVISFTVETNGRLPSGETLKEAIELVDAATDEGPAYYMVNCAHPTHLGDLPFTDAPWRNRIRGFRANASARSHAELDSATELDAGDPAELGLQFKVLRSHMPGVSVLGGCCGTDHRHAAMICDACVPITEY